MGTEPEAISLQPFLRSEAQVQRLREMAQLWQSGPETFWSADDILEAMSRSATEGYFALRGPDGPWLGLILADVGPFTADLLYVFVRSEARRLGLGRRLIEELLGVLEQRPQIEALLLEVRASNAGAQNLYKAMGMEQIGLRRAYYQNGEDALVFRYLLKEHRDS